MSEPTKKALAPMLRFPEFRDAGEWEEMTIGQISGTVTAGGTPSTSEKKYWGGNIRWMNSGELNNKKVYEVQGRITEEGLRNSSTKFIPERSVLIGLAGQGKTRGTVAMNMVKLCINQSIAAIFPSDENFYSDFLYHNLDNRYDELRSLSAGGEGRGGLNLQIIKSLGIPLPRLKEQQKIADCLTSIDELVTAQTQKVEAIKAHKKGLMQQLFPTEGETVPKRRFPEFRDAGEWKAKRLEDFAVIVRGGSPRPIDEFITNDANGLNWLKIGDIDKESKFVTSTQEKVIPAALTKTRVVNPGDLILSNSMSFGRPYILEIKTCIHDGWIAVSEIDKSLDRDYLYYLMMTSASQTYFSNNAAGSGVQNLNADIIKLLPVSYPNKTEQQKIADCLSSIDDLIAAQTQKLTDLKAHKKGLMQQLFPAVDEVNG